MTRLHLIIPPSPLPGWDSKQLSEHHYSLFHFLLWLPFPGGSRGNLGFVGSYPLLATWLVKESPASNNEVPDVMMSHGSVVITLWMSCEETLVWGKNLWFDANFTIEFSPNIKGSPCNIPKVMTSLPCDVVISGMLHGALPPPGKIPSTPCWHDNKTWQPDFVITQFLCVGPGWQHLKGPRSSSKLLWKKYRFKLRPFRLLVHHSVHNTQCQNTAQLWLGSKRHFLFAEKFPHRGHGFLASLSRNSPKCPQK